LCNFEKKIDFIDDLLIGCDLIKKHLFLMQKKDLIDEMGLIHINDFIS
jgi:hypothetical protein